MGVRSLAQGYIEAIARGREAADAKSDAQVVDVVRERVQRLPNRSTDNLADSLSPRLGVIVMSERDLKQGSAQFVLDESDAVPADAHDGSPLDESPKLSEGRA
jgi:hypothetical protein